MPYIIGIVLGDLLGRIGFFRAMGAALLLGGSAFLAHRIVGANVSPTLAYGAAIAAPLSLFGWAVWNPAASRFRLWIIDGVYLAARLAMWWAAIAFAVGLIKSGFRIDIWLRHDWVLIVMLGVFWAVQRALGMQTARSHRMMGDRSVVEL